MKKIEAAMKKMYPMLALNESAKNVLNTRPVGFHPLKRMEHRRECNHILNAYNTLLDKKAGKRHFGNKQVSPITAKRINELKKYI